MLDPSTLRSSATLHEQLLNAVGQAVIATDLEGRITYWNRAAEELYGWKEEEVLGRSVLEVTPAETTAEHASELMETLASGHSWSGEFMVRRRDGTTFPALVTDSPIYDQDGSLVGVVGVSSDISSQRRSARELERMRLGGIFDHRPAAMAILQGPDHVFERVNAAFLDSVGRQDVLGRTVAEAVPEIVDVAVPLLDEVYRTGRPFVGSEMLFQLLDSDRTSYTTRYFNFVYQPLSDVEGAVVGIFFHGVDVTEQVVVREEVREAAEASERVLAAGSAAVKKSELRLRSLVDAISQVVWVADEQGNVLEVSDRWSGDGRRFARGI